MSDGSSRFAGLNVAKIISRPLSANPLTAEPLTALRVGADSEVYVPKGDPDFIASEYIYWPLDDAEGLVPTKFSNVEGAPDLTFSSESGLWSSRGWAMASGSAGASTGSSVVLKDMLNLATLSDGMLIFACWVMSQDWAGEVSSDRSWLNYGAVFNNQPGLNLRKLQSSLTGWTPSAPASKAQAQLSGLNGGSIASASDLIGRLPGEGPMFLMVVLRNRGGFIEESLIIDGYQTDGTNLTTYPVWGTTEPALDFGFNIMQRNSATGVAQGFLTAGDTMRDMIIVRCETDQYMHVNKLASDAYKQGGGIPESWSAYL